MKRISVPVVSALVGLFAAFAVAGTRTGTAVVEPTALAVGGAAVVELSLACAHALVAASTACGQAGIGGAIGCAVSLVQMQQSCP